MIAEVHIAGKIVPEEDRIGVHVYSPKPLADTGVGDAVDKDLGVRGSCDEQCAGAGGEVTWFHGLVLVAER